jgi:hypothetical protein
MTDGSTTGRMREHGKMPPLAIPPVLVLTAIGAAVIARWVLREFRRVNDDLDALKRARAPEPVDRSRLKTLRRDPESGEYRPH